MHMRKKEEELIEKTNRLNVLNGLLNVDKRESECVDEKSEEMQATSDRGYER